MPIVRNIETGSYRCCVWQVTESLEQLLALLPDGGQSCWTEARRRFASSKRQLEFVSVRVLLSQMLSRQAVIAYYDSGKPYLPDSSLNISISHTADVVAVMLSSVAEVGVDVEQYGERVCRVAPRFLGETEQVPGVWPKLILWSAKETVYKMMNCRDVDFRTHLTASGLQPSGVYEPGCTGQFMMHTCHPTHSRDYQVHFEIHDHYVLTYSVAT